jgi:diguanylate cyclase (GGDEF)-like protein
MPHTRAEQALARLDSWRREFAGQTTDHGGQALSATFSAGIALYPDHGPTWEEALRLADLALYKAKTDGRNRSIGWDETITSSASA